MPIQFAENTTTSVVTPPASSVTLFVDSADGIPKYKDSSGTVHNFAGFTSPMTTLGDIIRATTAGVAQRLGIGTTGQVLTVVSGVPAWASPTTGGQSLVNINSKTASYTLLLTDFPTNGSTNDIQVTSGSATNVTIPPNSSVPAPIGSQVSMSQWGTGAVTFVAGAGVTFVTPFGAATTVQFDTRYARQVATNIWQIL